jgi:hypothetical protein
MDSGLLLECASLSYIEPEQEAHLSLVVEVKSLKVGHRLRDASANLRSTVRWIFLQTNFKGADRVSWSEDLSLINLILVLWFAFRMIAL